MFDNIYHNDSYMKDYKFFYIYNNVSRIFQYSIECEHQNSDISSQQSECIKQKN